MLRNALRQRLGTGFTQLRQHCGRTSQTHNCFRHCLLSLLQELRNLLQLLQLFLRLLQIIKCRLRTAAVLLLQAVNHIKTLLHLRSSLTVELTACHIFAKLSTAIVQTNPGTVGAFCQRCQTAVVACRILQLVTHTCQT